MFLVISEWAAIFVSSVLCSLAVKLLDDYLDRETDAACGEHNWINQLGAECVAYSLPLLATSVALRPGVGVSLFLASWAVGMYHDLSVKYPSGLLGWQESFIVAAVGFYFAGGGLMACALFLAGSVQLFDDMIDRYTDQVTGIRNLAHRWGLATCCFLCAAFLYGAWFSGGFAFFPVACGIAAVYAVSTRKRRDDHA